MKSWKCIIFCIPKKGSFSIDHAVVLDGTDFLFFGGMNQDLGSAISDIHRLSSPDFIWKKVGELNLARHGHSVAKINDIFVVVGGTGYFETEGCKQGSEFCDFCKKKTFLQELEIFNIKNLFLKQDPLLIRKGLCGLLDRKWTGTFL